MGRAGGSESCVPRLRGSTLFVLLLLNLTTKLHPGFKFISLAVAFITTFPGYQPKSFASRGVPSHLNRTTWPIRSLSIFSGALVMISKPSGATADGIAALAASSIAGVSSS